MFFTLLVSQVIIVTSLALTALWLYLKRMRNEDASEAEDSMGNSAGISKEFLSELQQKIATLEKEKEAYLNSDSIQLLGAEKLRTEELQKINQVTEDKLKSLETRILDYEVLKDEIGQLTQYKKENEKLKLELELLQKQVSAPPNAQAAARATTAVG